MDAAGFWDRRHDVEPVLTTETAVEAREPGGRHLVFLAAIDDPEARDVLMDGACRLDEFDCIETVPPEYLHVTVTVVGTEVTDPDGEDEHDPATIERIADGAEEALVEREPFTVEFPRLNLFPSVVFAECEAGGAFEELNQAVCEIPQVPVHDRDDDGFCPHVTLGQFVSESEFDELIEALERDRTIDTAPFRIEEIELIAADLSERFPAFETVSRFPLG